jgi:hypothetical protein
VTVGQVRFRAVVNGYETVLALTPEEGAALGLVPVQGAGPVVSKKREAPANKARAVKTEE